LSADTNNCNCIGTAFRLLIRAKVIIRVEHHRRSQRERQKGRVVWKYRLGSESLARLLIARNGRTPHTQGQPELNL
jgi:hypothetical protein